MTEMFKLTQETSAAKGKKGQPLAKGIRLEMKKEMIQEKLNSVDSDEDDKHYEESKAINDDSYDS